MDLGALSIKRITLVVFVAASCNLGWQFYRKYEADVERQRLYEDGWTVTACTFGPRQDEGARFHLEFFMLLAFIGGRAKGLKSTLLSVVGLSGAWIIYVFWWQYIFRLAENAEAPLESLPHFAYLYRGNVLDIGIAVSIVLLVLLNVRSAALSSFRLEADP